MIFVRPKEVISVWAGFGGAITEASAYNYSLLPAARKKAFLKAYYQDTNYAWGRVAIGSNDFCLAPYEYVSDSKLEDFSIEHDRQYILPLLRDIYAIKKLNLLASPWSPPSFMKDNKSLIGGKIKHKYYKVYAEYLHLFCEAYQKEGFQIDFLSMQNEPEASQRWESCVWTLKEQQKFIYNYLLPALKNSQTEIVVWDHNREKLYKVATELLSDKVAGIAFHNYTGVYTEQMRLVHQKYPKSLMLGSETCAAFEGSWQGAAEYYIKDIISCINAGVNAYLDWNLLLDSTGGPTWAKNPVKSPIILNENRDDFIKTPIYEYLKIISRAFPPGTRIVKTLDEEHLLAAAGVYDGNIRIVLMNISDQSKKFEIDTDGFLIRGIMPPHTILQR
ncbi:hypothetical protein IJI55_01565 [Candidatus Saccharibacteria bacterium]|nr:hypothetical protein [Candidatus Saccharibacteria bacterium]